jgi:signal transduction histidine kinase
MFVTDARRGASPRHRPVGRARAGSLVLGPATDSHRAAGGYRSRVSSNGDCRSELHAVSSVVLAVTSHLSVGEVLQTIVTSARQLLGARYAALGVPDDAGSFAEFVVDGVSDEQWRAIGPLPRQHGLLGLMLHEPTPVRLSDIRAHPKFGWWPAAHPVLVDFLGMPIIDGDQILGALYLANKPGGFTAEDEDLVRLIAAHAAIALVNARLHERVRELSIVEERNRIARELHDAVTQKLFSLRLTADAAATLLGRDPPRAEQAAGELATLRRLAADATDELRTIVVGLHPADLAGDGLNLALRKHIELLDRVHEARVRYTGEPVPRLSAAREQAVYRVAQEALHNALRHAAPSLVEVELTGRDGALVLQVSDDGRGFNLAAQEGPAGREGPAAGEDSAGREGSGEAVGASRRLGLASMRERARSVGGRLAVVSQPGGGTTVRLEIPLNGSAAPGSKGDRA